MQLFLATLDGFELRILDIVDSINQGIVRQDFVGADGANLYNMGRTAREIKFRAYFYGQSQLLQGQIKNATYDNHLDFLDKLTDTSSQLDNTSHSLVHPKYGQLYGAIESIVVTHDDTQDFVAIDISFVEDGVQQGSGIVSSNQSLQSILNQQALAAINDQIKTGVPNALTQNGLAGALGKAVSASKSMLSQIKTGSQAVRGFVHEADNFCNGLDSYLSEITSTVKTVGSAINYVGDLPSRVIGSIVNCSDRIMTTLSDLSNLPVNFVNSAIYQMDALKESVTGQHASFFKSTMTSIWAGTLAAKTGGLYQADDIADAASRAVEKSKSFDASGRRLTVTPLPYPMTVTQVENLAYTTRQFIQGALDLNREQYRLRSMAAAIQSYVSTQKLAKQRQIIMTVPGTIPLHLLALQTGQPYNSADRVLRVNPNIHNPTFASGEVKVYVK